MADLGGGIRRVGGLVLAAAIGFLAGLAVPRGAGPAPALETAGGTGAAAAEAGSDMPASGGVRKVEAAPDPAGAEAPKADVTPQAESVGAVSAGAALLVGTVLDVEGRPAGGVKVAAWLAAADGPAVDASVRTSLDASKVNNRAEVIARVTTAPDGSFAVAVPAGEPVRIAAASSGFATGVELRPVPGENPQVVLRFVAPPPGPAISGTVWDDEGHRVEGAVVCANSKAGPVEALTDATGRFTLPPLGRAWDAFNLDVRKTGLRYVPFNSVRGWGDGGVEIVLFRAEPEAVVRGRIRMGDGLPIPGGLEISATLAEADPNEQWLPLRIDPDPETGAFEASLHTGGTVTLEARGVDHGADPRTVGVVRAGETLEVELVVEPRPRPRIVVLDGDGLPAGRHGRDEVDASLRPLQRPLPAARGSGLGAPGLGGESEGPEVTIEDGHIVRVPRGLAGAWRLDIRPDHDRLERTRIVASDGAWPATVRLRRLVPALAARIVATSGHADDQFGVEGEWKSGGETGTFRVTTRDWREPSGPVVEVLRPDTGAATEVQFVLRHPGFRPLTFGPATLAPGTTLPVTEIRLERD